MWFVPFHKNSEQQKTLKAAAVKKETLRHTFNKKGKKDSNYAEEGPTQVSFLDVGGQYQKEPFFVQNDVGP